MIGAGGFGLFEVLRRIYGSNDAGRPGVTFTAGDQTGTTIINIAGDVHGIIVPTPTARLLVDPEVNRNVKLVLQPLQKEGYQDLSFLHGDHRVAHINKEEAQRIIVDAPLDLSSPPTESTSHIRGAVRIKSPHYEGGARWSLLWQGRAIDAEMKDDAARWVDDFQHNRVSAPPNTLLDVSMTEMVKLDANGVAVGKPTYIVHEVHSVTPPLRRKPPFRFRGVSSPSIALTEPKSNGSPEER